jgi:hypothetical protein
MYGFNWSESNLGRGDVAPERGLAGERRPGNVELAMIISSAIDRTALWQKVRLCVESERVCFVLFGYRALYVRCAVTSCHRSPPYIHTQHV